jgi:hypothetical protein
VSERNFWMREPKTLSFEAELAKGRRGQGERVRC